MRLRAHGNPADWDVGIRAQLDARTTRLYALVKSVRAADPACPLSLTLEIHFLSG